MRKVFIGMILVLTFCLGLQEASDSATPWVQSDHQGMSIRHPQGWKVSWEEKQVLVVHPQDPKIWCASQMYQWNGTSRQITQTLLGNLHTRVKDLRVLTEKQISQKPDRYGVKIIYQSEGVSVGSVILTFTADGQNFITSSYGAPVRVYDEMRLTFIPILYSFGLQPEGAKKAGPGSGGLQVIRSSQGIWSFRAPRDWIIVSPPGAGNEIIEGVLKGPKGEFVGVRSDEGSIVNGRLKQAQFGGAPPPPQQTRIPYLSAADLFQHVISPAAQLSMPDRQITDLKPVRMDLAQFSVIYTFNGIKYLEEGVIKNSSLPCTGMYDDLNPFTIYYIAAPSEIFSGVKNQLWQILNTFEPSPQFGTGVNYIIPFCAKMRRENTQALSNMAMQNIRTNQNIARQHVEIAQGRVEARRMEGDAWLRVFSGQEIARDPQTGKQYEVPIGGKYLYGSGTEVIRSDRPLSYSELPSGFKELESVGLDEKR